MNKPTKLSDKKTRKIEYISGIECTVINCIYNDEKQNCYAKKIQVNPMHAETNDDTKCATFQQKPSDSDIKL